MRLTEQRGMTWRVCVCVCVFSAGREIHHEAIHHGV